MPRFWVMAQGMISSANASSLHSRMWTIQLGQLSRYVALASRQHFFCETDARGTTSTAWWWASAIQERPQPLVILGALPTTSVSEPTRATRWKNADQRRLLFSANIAGQVCACR